MSATTVVKIEKVSKRFIIRKEKSLKERLVNFGRSNLHKDDFWALRDIDLDITSGSTIGLIGANGSGKSTLLKMIGGILQPTSGTVHLRGRLAALLELGAGFHPDLTGRENVYLNASILGLSRAQTDKHFDAIVDFSGIERFIDTQVKFYSSGMYVRLAFAVAVHVDPDILLVDEVLAVGDEPFQRKCMDRIRGFQHEGRTIVLVTHSLDQVAELCDRAVVLEHGAIIADGEPREALRTLRGEFEHTRQEEIAREQEAGQEAGSLPTSKARVEAIRLMGEDGTPVSEISPGQDLRIGLTLQADERVDQPIIGVGIDTPLGQNVFGTNTKLLGRRLDSLSGRKEVEFRLPGLQLGEGAYTVHGAIAADSGAELHRLIEGAQFTVTTGGGSVGFVWTQAEFAGSPT
ncbi:ABC transporter ATP-binding protein [Actinotalea sp. C106]|uniref:ABC transporter ATP-binding protein n=1 Tax=Actinotalea sp. C106 TaxID=2908644 RepID=UPI0020277936|nr:ABC transporter ATP-binding protein [Actinotalea sp. C106]